MGSDDGGARVGATVMRSYCLPDDCPRGSGSKGAGAGAGKSIRHAAAVPRLQPRRPTVTRLPLAMAMALMADSGQPVVRM